MRLKSLADSRGQFAARGPFRGLVASRLCLACALVLLAGSLKATIVPRMSLEEVVAASEAIVQGTVTRTWSAWDDGHHSIWTHYEIQVATQLKGDASGTIVVSEPGGTVGETALQVVGTPHYEVGEEVILFAERTPIGLLRTCGWGQGQFRVQRTAIGKATVKAASRGMELIERPSKTDQARTQQATPLGHVDGLDLEQFKTRVREVIAEVSLRSQ